MSNYFKFVTYYSLCVVDCLINFLSCIFGYYPGIQMGEDFLFAREYKHAGSVISDRVENREQKAQEAEYTMRSAKKTLEDMQIYGKRH